MMSEPEHEHDEDEAAERLATDDEAAEAEEAEATPDEAQEARQSVPGPSGPRSEKEIERALKSLESAGTTYRNRVSKIMGEDVQDMKPCPRCNTPVAGMIFDPAVAAVDDDTREAVLVSLGMGPEAAPEMREAEGVTMCDRCNGIGQLKYPTHNEHVKTQMCPRCQGQGYVNVPSEAPAAPVYPLPPVPTSTTSSTAPFGGAPDAWGRPAGHQHYGIAPANVGT